MNDTIAQEFFATYTRALLDRDAAAIADHYAVPALIAFPQQSVPVSDRSQTEQFFAGALAQYDGVTTAEADVNVIAETGHSLWADVSWTYDAAPGERNVYQLLRQDDTWRIAVLTPMDT